MNYTPVQKRLSINLSNLLHERNMSLRELSRRTGIGTTILSNYAKNKVNTPCITNVRKIAAALGISVGELLKEGGDYEYQYSRSFISKS